MSRGTTVMTSTLGGGGGVGVFLAHPAKSKNAVAETAAESFMIPALAIARVKLAASGGKCKRVFGRKGTEGGRTNLPLALRGSGRSIYTFSTSNATYEHEKQISSDNSLDGVRGSVDFYERSARAVRFWGATASRKRGGGAGRGRDVLIH